MRVARERPLRYSVCVRTWLNLLARPVFLAALCSNAWALGGHELLVLANGRSPASVRVARKFMDLRKIPDENLVHLPVPDYAVKPPCAISREDFTQFIWLPAHRAMKKHQIGDHILAWAYSTDFPVMISGDPGVSIQGITFLRNSPPDPEKVSKGRYLSPLFAGPSTPNGMEYSAQSLDIYRRWLGEDMPLPSMMLGYTGERGNTEAEVFACLETAVRSDGTLPTGTVYFVTSPDIRSKCRQWQFPRAARELTRLGVTTRITGDFPAGQRDVLGVMMGAANVKPREIGAFAPGAMAEHLTSAAGEFTTDSQTKLTAWLRAGASASAGTVVEPMSIWAKFPSANFYVHYASGCTMIESFFQSIHCPLQILLVGDPLAAPWAPLPGLLLSGTETTAGAAALQLNARVDDPGGYYADFRFLVDGRIVSEKASCRLSAAGMTDGPHTLRVVGYRTGLVRTQSFVQKSFAVREGKIFVEQ